MDFDAIMSKISAAAQTGMAKAKDLTEIAKLKMSSAAEQDAIRKAYTEIGKLYFAQNGADPDPAFAELCAKIAEHQEKIAYNDQRIADIKLSDDISDDDIEAVAAQFNDLEKADEAPTQDAPAEDTPAQDAPADPPQE